MSGGLFDYIQNQTLTEPPELPSEPRKRTPLEITQAEQQDAVEQARVVYRAYQENILKAGTLQSEILKGLYQGESTAVLLLKALEVISCMTGETVTYQVAKDTLMTVYGEVLRQPDSLEVARAEVQKRLVCLETALQGADSMERERILQAIKAHKEKLAQLSE
ncbi:MAG: hypothetical protein IKI37_11820 [Oscillospiraceae bacterium]|nr:hypothetical protein [Oscillospiraceae bacterium]